ncbi:MAG TPA: M20/M25/M40 family metallo-hydrolase [Cyclobacteriaceae bacterium]|nr:M20/M25/M40 family metallo-hydrolase [Cyclobacteriaceae bacterium]HPW61558.1 M20/M25/M40 family metallo-hydrolase [Cyclobacteriaceae bacterium]
MKTPKLLLFLLLLTISSFVSAQKIEEKNIKTHIKFLSDDALQGRLTGSEGERMALDYIEKQFKALKLQPKGESGSFEQKFPFKSGVHGTGTEGTAHNAVAYLDNKADKTIIIGAHFDHLGLGENGSSLDANPKGKIHNGADDNASGVAGVLELARYFSKNKISEKSNFLFICFSGEELGLYGSKYFTDHPSIDLTKVNYMINMDMIGRLNPTTKSISVSGSGTSPVWETLLKNMSGTQLNIKTDSAGVGPSDHTSFYLKNIPVLHFFTGSHSDYHKPSDDWDKINYEGEKEVLDLIIAVIEKLDTEPQLAFLPTKNKSMSSSRSFKVTMGVMPSYTSDVAGLLVDGATDGKPAQKAGIQTGDIITKIGDFEIKDIQTYMDALGKFEKGQTVPVKIKRKSEELTLNVTF